MTHPSEAAAFAYVERRKDRPDRVADTNVSLDVVAGAAKREGHDKPDSLRQQCLYFRPLPQGYGEFLGNIADPPTQVSALPIGEPGHVVAQWVAKRQGLLAASGLDDGDNAVHIVQFVCIRQPGHSNRFAYERLDFVPEQPEPRVSMRAYFAVLQFAVANGLENRRLRDALFVARGFVADRRTRH